MFIIHKDISRHIPRQTRFQNNTLISTSTIQYSVKRWTVWYLQHHAKITRGNSVIIPQVIISIKPTVQNNDYPASKTSISYCNESRERRVAEEDQKITMICLPYIKGSVEKDLKDMCSIQQQANIQKQSNLVSTYSSLKQRENMTKNYVHSISHSRTTERWNWLTPKSTAGGILEN